MKLAIMQPYFLPYVGYFQLIKSVDNFIVYDNIKYTKKGWINRNRMLQNGADCLFSLPLRKDSDALDVVQRFLSVDFSRVKLLNQIIGAYRKAPHFDQSMQLIEQIICFKENNLFAYLHNSIVQVCQFLDIATTIQVSSSIEIDHELQSQERVLALCEATNAKVYVNSIGGLELYSKEEFHNRNIELKFLKSRLFEYCQFGKPFIPWLSILDLMMFIPQGDLRDLINHNYDLI